MGLTPRGVEYPDASTGMSILSITQTLATTTDTAIGALASAVNSLGVWQSYSPVWTATTTNPTLGNGTLSGRWTQIGRTVHFTISLTIGSTTTFGSGSWWFTVPVAASSGAMPVGQARLSDASNSSNSAVGVARMTNGANIVVANTADGALATGTAPFAWANGDILYISGTYETAA